MITFGTFYFLVPRLVGAELYSVRLANIHFWLALAGTMLYVLSMWGAGVSQGLLWLSLDELGELSYGFREHHGKHDAVLRTSFLSQVRYS